MTPKNPATQNPARQKAVAARHRGKVRTVLVVDDNRSAAQALAKIFSGSGYRVELAHDGENAVVMARGTEPDAVILDINLPAIDGYGVAQLLRREHPSVLLIALTGYYGRKEDRAKAAAAGFDHYLTRPILAAEIEKLFRAPR